MKVNGEDRLEKGKESKFGLMEQNMRENGKKIKLIFYVSKL